MGGLKKFWHVLASTVLVGCLVAPSVRAEDSSVTRDEINSLKRQLAELETRLAAQEVVKEQVVVQDQAALREDIKQAIKEDLKRDLSVKDGLAQIKEKSGVSVGGNLKLRFYDHVRGSRNDIVGDSDSGFGFGSFYLYINSQISDKLSIDVQPHFGAASTGATPSFKSPFGPPPTEFNPKLTKTGLDGEFDGYVKAYATYVLPNDYQLSFGIVHPRFTLDYGAQLFYDEEVNASKVTANPWLGAWHDTGFELYKNFDTEDFSLPVYLYLLNGDGRSGSAEFADNNQGPSALLHIEPQIGPVTLLGSIGGGKWDDEGGSDNFLRYAGGFNWQATEKLTVRSEYMGGEWDNFIGGDETARTSGYYAKIFYKVLPKLTLMANYNVANHNFHGFFFAGNGDDEEYETLTLGCQYELADSANILFQYDNADWEKDAGTTSGEEIDFDRYTLAFRVTF